MLGLGEGERELARAFPSRCCIAFSMLGYAILRNSSRPSRQDVVLPFLVRSKLFLAKATTSRRDVCSKYCGGYATSFPRKGRNCKPSLATCVSPISPGASVKGELLPTLAARTCFNFAFVSPYLLCKPNLDDTYQLSHCCNPSLATCVSPISPGASVKGELLPTLAARTCFNFAFVSPYLLCKPNLDDTCRLSHCCKPSLAACVSPISPGASVKGELLPTLAARTCFNFAFVSPYLLCKPNLDDTCRLSHNI